MAAAAAAERGGGGGGDGSGGDGGTSTARWSKRGRGDGGGTGTPVQRLCKMDVAAAAAATGQHRRWRCMHLHSMTPPGGSSSLILLCCCRCMGKGGGLCPAGGQWHNYDTARRIRGPVVSSSTSSRFRQLVSAAMLCSRSKKGYAAAWVWNWRQAWQHLTVPAAAACSPLPVLGGAGLSAVSRVSRGGRWPSRGCSGSGCNAAAAFPPSTALVAHSLRQAAASIQQQHL